VSSEELEELVPYSLITATAPGMKPGTAVELHGLVAKPELNGQKGCIIALEPKTGRYGVTLDDSSSEQFGSEYKFKPCNLRAEYSEQVFGDLLLVHGMNYCAKHRLERCGSCCTNFSLNNRLTELGYHRPGLSKADADRIMKQAKQMCEEEAATNQPPRRAPDPPDAAKVTAHKTAAREDKPAAADAIVGAPAASPAAAAPPVESVAQQQREMGKEIQERAARMQKELEANQERRM
jgi:hypothetical protein